MPNYQSGGAFLPAADYDAAGAWNFRTTPTSGVAGATSLVGTTDTQTLTNKTLTSPTITGGSITPTATSYLIDGAIAVTSHTAILTKATAGAYTIAAPSADGVIIDLVSTTSAAHVITGTNLFWAGVTGGPFNKVTFTAFPSHGFRLIGHTGIWHVLASALGTGTVGD